MLELLRRPADSGAVTYFADRLAAGWRVERVVTAIVTSAEYRTNARAEPLNEGFVVLGDGECNEGSVWEAAMCAGKHGLSNLTAIVDYNKHQSYASTKEVQDLEPFGDKWRSFGFAVREVDGHDVAALRETFVALPFDANKPSAIIAHTVKGKGLSLAEGVYTWHSIVPTEDDFERARQELESDELDVLDNHQLSRTGVRA